MEVNSILNFEQVSPTNGSSKTSAKLSKAEKKLKEVCEDFESVFISYVLSQMRKSSESENELLNENSTAMKIYKGMLDEEYALQMARSGQIGIANMLFEQLRTGLIQQNSETENGSIQPSTLNNLNSNLAQQLSMTLMENTDNLTENLINQHLQSLINNHQSKITQNLSEQFLTQQNKTNIEILTKNLVNQYIKFANENQQLTVENLQTINNMQTFGNQQIDNQQVFSTMQTENRIMLQIVQKLGSSLGADIREAIINLEPPDLGHLHIRLILDSNNIMSARINVDNGTVANMLNNNLSNLRTSLLNNHGIQIDSFNVTVGNHLAQPNRGDDNAGRYQENFRGNSIKDLAGSTTISEPIIKRDVYTATRYFVNYLV